MTVFKNRQLFDLDGWALSKKTPLFAWLQDITWQRESITLAQIFAAFSQDKNTFGDNIIIINSSGSDITAITSHIIQGLLLFWWTHGIIFVIYDDIDMNKFLEFLWTKALYYTFMHTITIIPCTLPAHTTTSTTGHEKAERRREGETTKLWEK